MMNSKKKIIFFIQSGVGGAERVTVTIAKMLSREDYEIVFALLTKPGDNQAIKHFVPETDKVINICNKGGFHLLFQLYKCIKAEKPSIVFASMMYINTKVLAVSKLFPKTRFVVRNNNYLYTLSKLQRLTLKYSYKFADKIIAQTDEMRNELIGIGVNKDRVVTLHNPIDTNTIHANLRDPNPFPCDNIVRYVASGRFNHVKGFDILIESFSIVIKKEPQSELYIIGKTDGNCQDYYNRIQKRIKELKLENNIHCIGFQANPYVYVKNANCFVLSSRNEGLPNVLIEALYMGTPAASSNCIPIIGRIIEEGVTGYLADVEDVSSLAKAMLQASKLGRVNSTYKSADQSSILKIFQYD